MTTNSKRYVCSFHRTGMTSRSDILLCHIRRRGRLVRAWHDSDGREVGVWRTKGGRSAVVGHDKRGLVVMYWSEGPGDKWQLGSGAGPLPAPAPAGLDEAANDTVQLIVQALRDLEIMQRVDDYARGRDRDGQPWQERLDHLYKQIY